MRRAVVCLSAVAMVTAGCTSGGEEATTPPPTTSTPSATATTTPTTTPTPTPTVTPVKGKRVTRVESVSSDRVLGLGSRSGPNRKAVNRAMGAVGNWLDRHLDRLQRTGRGHWGQVAPRGLANRKGRRPVTTRLASPERPVKAARYVLTAFHDGAPEMVTAGVTVQHPEGRPSRVHLVFTINGQGKPVLTLFGPPAQERQQGGSS